MRDIIQWLDQVRGKNQGTLTLSLRNHREDGKAEQIDSWDLPPDLDPTQLWKQIEAAAQQDADLLGGPQRYAVVCMRERDHLSRRLFMLEGRIEAGTLNNPSAENALVNTLLRQQADQHAFIMKQWEAIRNPLLGELSRLTARCEKLEDRDDMRRAAFEGAVSQAHERELATFLAKHQASMSQEFVHGLRMLLPWAVNSAAGKQLLPTNGTATPADQSLKALFESIRPDQLDALRGILNEHQTIAVLQAYQHYVGDGKPAAKA